MKTFLLTIATLALVLIALSMAVFATAVGCLIYYAAEIDEMIDEVEAEEAATIEYALGYFVDRLNESGFDRPPIDPDDPLLKRRTIVISEDVQERLATRVIERLHYLDALDPGEPIELRIATSGGWLDSAFAIVDTMRSLESPVNATAMGGCYSAGTVILAGVTGERIATPSTLLSVHMNDYWRDGDEFDADKHEYARFRRIYLRHTKAPKEWFEEEGEHHYYFDAQRALDMELIDRIAEPAWDEPAAPAEETRDAA